MAVASDAWFYGRAWENHHNNSCARRADGWPEVATITVPRHRPNPERLEVVELRRRERARAAAGAPRRESGAKPGAPVEAGHGHAAMTSAHVS